MSAAERVLPAAPGRGAFGAAAVPFVTRALRRGGGTLAAFAVLALVSGVFLGLHPRGASLGVVTAWSNQGTALALLAIGQTIVVLSRGIDLSIGPVMALCNCIASRLVDGSPGEIAIGIAAVLAAGLACGFVNGLVVVHLRMQAIVATLATGAIYGGFALIVQPIPGGRVAPDLADAMTWTLLDLVPVSAVIVVVAAALWYWVRKLPLGRAIVATGSSEAAARATGLPVDRAKIFAYALSGLFAALGGLFVAFQTLSGDPAIGLGYTLNSIAAVVIGGTALTGGSGSILGSIAGALILRTIGSLIFVGDIDPLAQPLFEGLVLLAAVALGTTRILRMGHRLELFR